MRNLFLAALLGLVCAMAHGQTAQLQSFQATGKTATFTAAGTCPTPVQTSSPVVGSQQYIIVNNGSVTAWIAAGSTATIATANCVIPTGTQRYAIPIPPGAVFVLTYPSNQFFTGITSSSTAIIYIAPGSGT